MEKVVEQKDSEKVVEPEVVKKPILVLKNVKRTMIYCKQTNKIIGTKVVPREDNKEDSDDYYVCRKCYFGYDDSWGQCECY